jgi:hypothetical protein
MRMYDRQTRFMGLDWRCGIFSPLTGDLDHFFLLALRMSLVSLLWGQDPHSLNMYD